MTAVVRRELAGKVAVVAGGATGNSQLINIDGGAVLR